MSRFRSRVALGLARTRDLLLTDVTDLFSGTIDLTDDLLDDLEHRLLAADLGVDTVEEIRDRLRKDMRGQKVSGPDDVIAAMSDVIERILTPGVPPKGIGERLAARSDPGSSREGCARTLLAGWLPGPSG